MYKGVFWIIEGKLCAFPFKKDEKIGVAKSGTTYNHEKLWEYVKPRGCNHPYNYYPRGRVDVTNKNQPVIYMNPHVDHSFLPQIKAEFDIVENPVIRIDNSEHYKCYLDHDSFNGTISEDRKAGYEAGKKILKKYRQLMDGLKNR